MKMIFITLLSGEEASMLEVLLKAYLKQAASEKETSLVLGHSRGLLTWSSKYLEASSKVRTIYLLP